MRDKHKMLGCEMFGSQLFTTGCDTSLQQKQVKINFMKNLLTGDSDDGENMDSTRDEDLVLITLVKKKKRTFLGRVEEPVLGYMLHWTSVFAEYINPALNRSRRTGSRAQKTK